MIDGELYLPAEWIADGARRTETGVPANTELATKGDLALVLLQRALASGHWTGRWVTGDAVYGSDSGLRDGMDAAGCWANPGSGAAKSAPAVTKNFLRRVCFKSLPRTVLTPNE